MSMQMRRILGNPEALKAVKAVPFEPGVVDFLDAVSKAIMKHPESRKIPGLHAFGFWCRKKHLLQLKAKYQISDERCGKGLVFQYPRIVCMVYGYRFAYGQQQSCACFCRRK